MMGSHHMVEKSVMYEEAVRVPWLMRVPQIRRGRRSVEACVSQIDMMPTLIELMAGHRAGHLPGQSLAGLMAGGRAEEDHVFIEWNPNSGALKVKPGGTKLAPKEELGRLENERSRAVISPDGWKMCLSDTDLCQLFDLNKDPGETRNLFYTGRHADVIRRLRAELHRWQESVGDTARV